MRNALLVGEALLVGGAVLVGRLLGSLVVLLRSLLPLPVSLGHRQVPLVHL
jgi:hypothetical protein